MISTQRVDRQLVRRDPLAHAVVEHLGRGPRRRAEPALDQVLEDLVRAPCPSARTCSGPPSASRRAGAAAAPRPWPAAATCRTPRASGRDGSRPACRARSRRTRPLRGSASAKSSSDDLVGVRRALALAEPAEGAADDADVGEVDVAVDDEGDPVPGQLRAQLVGGDPHLLDHLRPRLGEERRQLVLASAPRPRAPWRSPARRQPGVERLLAPPPRPAPRDEAPVLQLDHVEDPLLHPLRVHVLRVDAEPLGQRVAPAAPAPCAPGAGSGTACSGEMWSPLADSPPRSVAPASTSSGHQSREVRRHLHPDVRHQPLALRDQPLDVLDRRPGSPSSAARAALRRAARGGGRGPLRRSLHGCCSAEGSPSSAHLLARSLDRRCPPPRAP